MDEQTNSRAALAEDGDTREQSLNREASGLSASSKGSGETGYDPLEETVGVFGDHTVIDTLAVETETSRSELDEVKARRHLAELRFAQAKQEISSLTAALEGYERSTSWKITAPLRASVRGNRWVARNARRSLRFAWWLGTGQFSRARSALVPYAEKVRNATSRFADSKGGKGESIQPSEPMPDSAYAEWVARNDTLHDHDRHLIREHIATFQASPSFSILMPVFAPGGDHLRETISSLQEQLYENWELCIAYDTLAIGDAASVLEELDALDGRIRLLPVNSDRGTVGRTMASLSNAAIEAASGDWIAFAEPGDRVAEHALYLVAERIGQAPDANLLYSDEDRIDSEGRRFGHYFKPDWNYDQFLGRNYIRDLCVYRASVVREAGGIRAGFEGAQRWDLALRALETDPSRPVEHIPFVLYHRRKEPTLSSDNSSADTAGAAQRAVNEHLDRTGQLAEARRLDASDHSTFLRIGWRIPEPQPLVSIVIPTRDHADMLRRCIDGLLHRTHYSPIEIVIVDNGSIEPDALALLAELRRRDGVRVIDDPSPFNYSRLVNRGVAEASGEICVLLNNDIEIVDADWLDELVGHALRPEVGAVGAKLLYPDGRLQHGGVILGMGGTAGHIHRFADRDFSGYADRLRLTHRLSCVTGACLALRRETYLAVGGLDEALAVAYNDVDLCLRLGEAGYVTVWTPFSELTHVESASRGPDLTDAQNSRLRHERAIMKRRWGDALRSDPFYNPNLNLAPNKELTCAPLPRVEKPWRTFQWPGDECISQDTARALSRAAIDRMNGSVAERVATVDLYRTVMGDYCRRKRHFANETREGIQTPRDRSGLKIAVFTAIIGEYDSLKLPSHLDSAFDYYLFTDRTAPDTGVFQVRPAPFHCDDPTRTARYIKTHPHTLLAEYDLAIWADANVMVLGDFRTSIANFLASGRCVGAFPHPMRTSVVDEIEACSTFNKDEPEILDSKRQECSRSDDDDLIESGFMIFDLRDEKTSRFLDRWWSLIDRGSKRDQLSIMSALSDIELDWHRLTKRPNSLRNHPDLAFVGHDGGRGAAQELIDALHLPSVNPFAGQSFAEVREHRIRAHSHRHIDVVVCIHNSLEDVRRCLESVERARVGAAYRLILIDDGSDVATARHLRNWAEGKEWVELHRNETPQRYTRAANKGLAASTGELVILLNSDTIVTDGWAEKMADAVFSTKGAGIVGPMSSAASHQSLPDHVGSSSQTAVNELPDGITAEDMNRYCERWTVKDVLPRVPLVHGFCFGITRDALDALGHFDEEHFPNGYGEENEYCFRAADKGFCGVIATHTYVFHAKSKSYPDAERVVLLHAGGQSLERLHGAPRIDRAVRSMKSNPIFTDLRRKAAALYAMRQSCSARKSAESGRRSNGAAHKPRNVHATIPLGSDGRAEGSGFIRVVRPLNHASLARSLSVSFEPGGWTGEVPSCNALLVQRDGIRCPMQAEKIVDQSRKRGFRLVYEIDDDLLNLPDGHSAANRFSPEVRSAMEIVISEADAVVVPTEVLKERLSSLNKNVFILPNALDETLWQPPTRDMAFDPGKSPINIVYMGTRTHDDDLAVIAEPMREIKRRYGDQVNLACVGACAGPLPDFAVATDIPPAARTYPEFARWFSSQTRFDIAVGPLADTAFNRHKSYLKYLDYGICRLPTVFSDITPYRHAVRHGETGLLVENTTDAWVQALRLLIDHPEERARLADNAFRDVIAHHTLEAQSSERRRIWQQILD